MITNIAVNKVKKETKNNNGRTTKPHSNIGPLSISKIDKKYDAPPTPSTFTRSHLTSAIRHTSYLTFPMYIASYGNAQSQCGIPEQVDVDRLIVGVLPVFPQKNSQCLEGYGLLFVLTHMVLHMILSGPKDTKQRKNSGDTYLPRHDMTMSGRRQSREVRNLRLVHTNCVDHPAANPRGINVEGRTEFALHSRPKGYTFVGGLPRCRLIAEKGALVGGDSEAIEENLWKRRSERGIVRSAVIVYPPHFRKQTKPLIPVHFDNNRSRQ